MPVTAISVGTKNLLASESWAAASPVKKSLSPLFYFFIFHVRNLIEPGEKKKCVCLAYAARGIYPIFVERHLFRFVGFGFRLDYQLPPKSSRIV